MATYSKTKLSASTNGKGVKVVATASAGTTIHTAVSGTSDWDEVWVYGMNTSGSSVDLTLEFGGMVDPDNVIEVTIPSESGLQLIVPGLLLQNSLVLSAFASSANVIVLYGFVNRVSS